MGSFEKLGEGAHQILDAAGRLPVAPQVVGASRQHRLRADGRFLDAGSPVGLDGREQGFVRHYDLEGVDVVALIDGYHHGVCLPDGLRDTPSRRFRLAGEHMLPDRIDGLVLELAADLYPTEILPDSCTRRVEPVLRRNRQDDGITMDPGAVGRGRLVDEPPGFRVGFAGLRGRLWPEDTVVELTVVPRCRAVVQAGDGPSRLPRTRRR